MSAPRSFRVLVFEWLMHEAIITADSEEAAEAEAHRLWAENAETQAFHFEDSGIDGITVEELDDPCETE